MNENEKYEKGSSEACEKILRAIHRIATCGQAPNHADTEADPSRKALGTHTKPEGGHGITLALENGEGKSSTSDMRANEPKLESPVVDQEGKRSGHDIDRRTSDYINRTWLKFRSMSNFGRGKNHSPTKKDTEHDQFGDYINRAKKKLRTTSSMGGGGGRSFSSK